MFTKSLTFTLVWLFSHALLAQLDFSAQIQIIPKQLSFIPDVRQTFKSDPIRLSEVANIPSVQYLVTRSYKTKESFFADLNIGTQINSRLTLNTGLGLSLYRYQEHTEISISPSQTSYNTSNVDRYILPGKEYELLYGEQFLNGTLTNLTADSSPANDEMYLEKLGNTKIGYLTIPISFTYSIIPEKLYATSGVSIYTLAFSAVFKRNEYTYTIVKDRSGDGINNLGVKGQFSLEYQLTKNIRLFTIHNYVFHNLNFCHVLKARKASNQ